MCRWFVCVCLFLLLEVVILLTHLLSNLFASINEAISIFWNPLMLNFHLQVFISFAWIYELIPIPFCTCHTLLSPI